MKKILSLLMAFALLIMVSLSGVERASADNSQTVNGDISTKEMKEANIVQEHLVLEPGTNTITIINEKELERSLEKISSDTSIAELKEDINTINMQMTIDNGNIQPAGLCEIALGAMSLYQGATISSAMSILGLTSAAGLGAVTLLTGAIWTGGALFCP